MDFFERAVRVKHMKNSQDALTRLGKIVKEYSKDLRQMDFME
jgi:hypothetical protein